MMSLSLLAGRTVAALLIVIARVVTRSIRLEIPTLTLYQLDWSISVLRVVGVFFIFIQT